MKKEKKQELCESDNWLDGKVSLNSCRRDIAAGLDDAEEFTRSLIELLGDPTKIVTDFLKKITDLKKELATMIKELRGKKK